MIFLEGIKKNNLNKTLNQLIVWLILLILFLLGARLFRLRPNKEQFTNELFIPYEDSMKILQNGIMNNDAITQIIKSKLAEYSIKESSLDNTISEIPKLLHFIWIGSSMPEKYIANINTYIANNPGYDIWIWHDENTNPEQMQNQIINLQKCKMQNINLNQMQFVNANGIEKMKNWAGKADIIRYEIIYNYGGMYIDVDSRSVKGFDNNFKNSFVCLETGGHYNNIQNAQFGFNQKSPYLEFVIACLYENIMQHITQYGNLDDILSICGPPFFTTCFYWWMKTNKSYPINCINQEFTIIKNDFSYNYHTMDKNW